MAFSTVTVEDVAISLGRPLTASEEAQAAMWIEDAETLIRVALGDLGALDLGALRIVVLESVAGRIRRAPLGGAESVTVSVDDASVTNRYSTSSSDEWLLTGWRTMLTPAESGAFSTRPSFEPDVPTCAPWSWL